MNNKNIGRSALYLTMTLILAACGGTSDDEGGFKGGTPSGKIVLDPDGYATRQASITDLADVEAATQVYREVLNVSFLNLIDEIEERIAKNWPAPTKSGNRNTWNCENKNTTGTVAVTIRRSGTYEDLRWQFSNCEVLTDSYGRLLLDGSYRYVNQLSRAATGNNLLGFEEFLLEGTFLTAEEDFQIQGVTNWDEFYAANDAFASIHRIGALELIRDGQYLALSNVTKSFVEDDQGSVYEVEGKVIGSAIDGYVTLSTLTDVDQPEGKNCPDTGEVRLAGSGNTKAEILFGSSSRTSDAAVIEINGSRAKALTCAEAARIFQARNRLVSPASAETFNP